MIAVYESGFNERDQREGAMRIVSTLANRHDFVLTRVFEDARRYARNQHIDDAFPYDPNTFDVLAEMGQGNVKVISFLKATVENDWGIPRWKAIEVLCRLDDPNADEVLVDVINGKHPSRNPDVLNDLREIEQIKGRSFVERYESTA